MVISTGSDVASFALGRRQTTPWRPALGGVVVASVVALAAGVCELSAAASPAQAQSAPAAAAAASAPRVAQAKAAAERILKASQSRNAEAYFALFADELKATSSPALVASVMATRPTILSWRISSIDVGLDTATVDVRLETAKGPLNVVLLINDEGQLEAYQADLSARAATAVAGRFINAVLQGKFVEARSFLSLPMQQEISPASLQSKWLNLQRETGNYVRTRRIVESERTGDTRLVLVNLEFTRMADSLYVILDDRNQIVGLDFPRDPAVIKPAR